MFETLWQDIRLTWRMMARQKAFSAAALLTLALGIGANTAIFSIVHGVLLRPLPYPEPDRLVQVSEAHPGANAPIAAPLFSHFTYNAWREAPTTVEDVGGFTNRAYIVEGAAGRVRGAALTPQIFGLLRATPLAGRLLDERDAAAGAEPVVVLSHGYWQERYGGDPAVVGRVIDLDTEAHTIVGIMPAGFYFPERQHRLWTAYRVPPSADVQGIALFGAIARLRPGVTPEQAAAEATGVARGAERNEMIANLVFGVGGPVAVSARTLLDQMTAGVRPALVLLLAAVGLVLLIACANVANLFLSRGAARRREIAIRAAVGAGSGRLARQLLTESLTYAVVGGALGLGLGWALTRLLPALAPQGFPRLDDVAVDVRVMAFAAIVSIVAGLLAGVVPAWRGARPDLVPALRESAGASGGPRARRVRAALLVAEAALAVVLIVGAALLARSFVALVQVDAGYDPDNVLTARLHVPGPATGRADRVGSILEPLLERLRATPGVEAAGATNMAPLGGSTAIMGFNIRGGDGEEREARALAYVVTPGYAEALSLRLRDGRLFTAGDLGGGGRTMLVNEEFVRTYLIDGRPVVGRTITLPGPPEEPAADVEIVGVVANVLKDGFDRRPQAEIYQLPRSGARYAGDVSVVLKTTGDPTALAPTVRAILGEIDRQAVLDPVATLASQVDRSVSEPRFAALVLLAFAGLALVLAATGLYGVLSHTVVQRRREMGVRLAIGATRSDIVRLIVGQGLGVTALGLGLGLVAAIGTTRLMEGLLFGITPLDTVAFAAAPALLFAVSLVACLLPALRAAATDPVEALRSE
ncbi:MAG: ABC transporter permease [Vicinamibacterales bacterium]|nr:ABC transporter permease [Vicinamibacterales bacterium]